MKNIQDLEDLKRKALDLENNFEITRSKVIELIDRLQAAEKSQEVDVTPLITDHQGRPMTYWGGKSKQDPVAQSRNSAEPVASALNVCPVKDIECGKNPMSWCESCPLQSHNAVEAKQDGFVETSVPDALEYGDIGANAHENTLYEGYCAGWNDCRRAIAEGGK